MTCQALSSFDSKFKNLIPIQLGWQCLRLWRFPAHKSTSTIYSGQNIPPPTHTHSFSGLNLLHIYLINLSIFKTIRMSKKWECQENVATREITRTTTVTVLRPLVPTEVKIDKTNLHVANCEQDSDALFTFSFSPESGANSKWEGCIKSVNKPVLWVRTFRTLKMNPSQLVGATAIRAMVPTTTTMTIKDMFS